MASMTSGFAQAGDYTKPKVRAITAFVRLDPATSADQVSNALMVLRAVQSQFADEGYETQTLRIVTQPLAELVQGLSESQALAFLKNLDELAPLADRAYIMEKGRIVWEGVTAALTGTDELRLRYLGV